MKNRHKTARGTNFDMEAFTQNNQKQIALGNMNVNARGDLLGPGGKIVKKREEVVREYYRENINVVKDVALNTEKKNAHKATPSLEIPTVFKTPEEALKELTDKAEKQKSRTKDKDKEEGTK